MERIQKKCNLKKNQIKKLQKNLKSYKKIKKVTGKKKNK